MRHMLVTWERSKKGKLGAMVEVFKTNIYSQSEAEWTIQILKQIFPQYKINVDLMDCDKILRVEHQGNIDSQTIIATLCHNIKIEILSG